LIGTIRQHRTHSWNSTRTSSAFSALEYDDSNSPNVVGHSSTNNVLTGIDFTAIGNANHISSLPPPPPGAGRGRGMVQPAWMTQQQQQQGH